MPVANSMLVLMVQVLFSRLEFPYAAIPWQLICLTHFGALMVLQLIAGFSLFTLIPMDTRWSTHFRKRIGFSTSSSSAVRNAWANPKRPLWVYLNVHMQVYMYIYVHLQYMIGYTSALLFACFTAVLCSQDVMYRQ